MKTTKVVTLIILLTTMNTSAQLSLKTYRADENSFHVASVLVYGKKDAVLIDAQFTKADAHRVVADILESQKNLTSIYISHGDPDYYFGLEVLTKAFPNVIVYATSPTVSHIEQTYQQKLAVWESKLGKNGTNNIILPRTLENNHIEIEGFKLEVKGLEGVNSKRSYIWIPTLKAIVGGVNIYDNLHLWIADAGNSKDRENWMKILEQMKKLNPSIVIPAHALNDNNVQGLAAIDYSLDYLKAYEKVVDKSKNSEELINAMNKLYPDAKLEIALQLGAKVSKGEMKW